MKVRSAAGSPGSSKADATRLRDRIDAASHRLANLEAQLSHIAPGQPAPPPEPEPEPSSAQVRPHPSSPIYFEQL